MSLPQVRTALEVALVAALGSGFAIAWENVAYTPVTGTPYAAAFVLRAQPDNLEIGPCFTERGVFQINLFYPPNAGPGTAEAQAAILRDAFPFGASFASGGVTVNIIKTPEVAAGRATEDRWMVPVKIPFTAFIGG